MTLTLVLPFCIIWYTIHTHFDLLWQINSSIYKVVRWEADKVF